MIGPNGGDLWWVNVFLMDFMVNYVYVYLCYDMFRWFTVIIMQLWR